MAPQSRSRVWPVVVLTMWATWSGRANAAPDDADALFNAGRELMQQGRFVDACPKFEQSQRTIPSVGTALNLGLCLEKLGHTASAAVAYREAMTLASALGPAEAKRIALARERLASLEPRLVKLVVKVAEDNPGLELKRDGLVIAKAQLGVALPVDPITHVIEASAPGKQTWQTTVTISGDGASTTVLVPPLVDEAKAATAVVAPERAAPPVDVVHRPVALTVALGAVGLVGLTAGTVLAFDAKSKYNDANALCDPTGCAPQAASIQDGAIGRGNLATAFFVVGAISAVGAAVVWFTLSSSSSSSARVGIGPSGLVVARRF